MDLPREDVSAPGFCLRSRRRRPLRGPFLQMLEKGGGREGGAPSLSSGKQTRGDICKQEDISMTDARGLSSIVTIDENVRFFSINVGDTEVARVRETAQTFAAQDIRAFR